MCRISNDDSQINEANDHFMMILHLCANELDFLSLLQEIDLIVSVVIQRILYWNAYWPHMQVDRGHT